MAEVFFALEAIVPDAIERSDLVAQARDLGRRWASLAPTDRRVLLLAIVGRIELRPEALEIHLRSHRLPGVLHGDTDHHDGAEYGGRLTLTVPVSLKRAGIGMRLLIVGPDANHRTRADHRLHRLLAQAHRYRAMVMREGDASMNDLAEEAGVVGSYFTRILRLSFLAPDIVAAMLRDRHPVDLTANRLSNDITLPIAWDAQRDLLGIR